MINVEITPLKFRAVYFRGEIEPVLLKRGKPLNRNYLQVAGRRECVNYIALQVRPEIHRDILMIPLRNLFITVAGTSSN